MPSITTRIEELIFEQVVLRPDSIAAEHNGDCLSYFELKGRSARVARSLEELGIRPGDAVGVYADRSVGVLALMLGIWSAGGVIVPINPDTPVKVIEWIIVDSSLRAIVTVNSCAEDLDRAWQNAGLYCSVLVLIDGLSPVIASTRELAAIPDPAAAARLEGWDKCYVIYTSGSQGRRKGVAGTHASLAHYLSWHTREFSVDSTDRCSQVAPLSFDFCLKEIFVPLIRGGCVCIADRSIVIDTFRFISWIEERRITLLCCVPALFRSLTQVCQDQRRKSLCQSMRSILISGDLLRWHDVLEWRRQFGDSAPLVNLYGPTESTVIKLFYRIPDSRPNGAIHVAVGKPIDDARVLIVDDGGFTCATGKVGEIVILCEWLALGYVNGTPTDNECFTRLVYEGAEIRAYRTGDLGRFLPDGNIEFVGRSDRQVKVYGHRIELDEIENVIAQCQGVRDVGVIVMPEACGLNDDQTGEPRAIACFFTTDPAGPSLSEVTTHARERLLPQIISATRFTRLSELPLSESGKVDRRKLALISAPDKPDTPTPVQLADSVVLRDHLYIIWKDLLHLDQVDLQANFFEIGGDSIRAIGLLRRLREELCPQVQLIDLFEYATISQLCSRIEQLNNDNNGHASNGHASNGHVQRRR
jgi:amino acid adenylation domain-containing protein